MPTYPDDLIKERTRIQLRGMGLEGLIDWFMDFWPRDLDQRDAVFGNELKKLQKKIIEQSGLADCPSCGRPMNDGLGVAQRESVATAKVAGSTPAPEPTLDEPRFTQDDEELVEIDKYLATEEKP